MDVTTSALSDLRRTRRIRRLGDTEWFDVAYQVYLAGFLGGGAVIVLSGFIGDVPLSPAEVSRVLAEGPSYLGLVVAVAIVIGLRSGAEGGPLAVEAADARHLLSAPIPRRTVLRRPLLQRARTIAGGAAVVGAITGLLASQRLPGGGRNWIASGAAFGVALGLVVVTLAVLVHAIRMPGWAASALGAGFVGWQSLTTAGHVAGPFDTLGDVALWGDRQRNIDLISVGLIAVMSASALLTVGLLRVEHLDRRGSLVSQLRFAVTTQDLRTVVLLRRQMRQERPRQRPLFQIPSLGHGHQTGAAIERSLRSMVRSPFNRLVRIATLGAGAGVAAAFAARGTTPAVLVAGILLFVMGLDLVEPVSQEIDHPDRSESLPIDSGWLHLRLLVGPAILAVLPAATGALACVFVAPATFPVVLVLALPITWAGMTGSVINVVRDERLGASSENVLVPPEMTGIQNVLVLLFPLMVSTIGPATVLAVRAVPTPAMAAQMAAVLGMYLVSFGVWVRKRGDLATSWSVLKQEAMP